MPLTRTCACTASKSRCGAPTSISYSVGNITTFNLTSHAATSHHNSRPRRPESFVLESYFTDSASDSDDCLSVWGLTSLQSISLACIYRARVLHHCSPNPLPLPQSLSMAYFNVEAEVVALVSQVISDSSGVGSKSVPASAPPQTQDAATTLHALFDTANAPNDEHGEDDERPQKRRKIDPKNTNYDHPAYLPEARSVPLAKVSINLVGPHFECCCCSRPQSDEFSDPRP